MKQNKKNILLFLSILFLAHKNLVSSSEGYAAPDQRIGIGIEPFVISGNPTITLEGRPVLTHEVHISKQNTYRALSVVVGSMGAWALKEQAQKKDDEISLSGVAVGLGMVIASTIAIAFTTDDTQHEEEKTAPNK